MQTDADRCRPGCGLHHDDDVVWAGPAGHAGFRVEKSRVGTTDKSTICNSFHCILVIAALVRGRASPESDEGRVQDSRIPPVAPPTPHPPSLTLT